MSKRKISGRTVVISGAASGIGRALAQRLSTHGCPVALTDIDELGLKETAAGLTGPTLTRTRFPSRTIEAIGPCTWLTAESSTSPRETGSSR